MADSLKKGIGPKYLLPIIAVYATTAGVLGLDQVREFQTAWQNLGAAGLAGILLLVFQDLMPPSFKEAAIFWRTRDRLPGCRAFSVIAKGDQRVDPTDLAVLLPNQPMTPTEQNALWYRWLKEVETDAGIADNHYRVLALRDAAVLLLLLALVSPLLGLLPDATARAPVILTLVCSAAYLITAVAARNAAVRLVANVIARKVATS